MSKTANLSDRSRPAFSVDGATIAAPPLTAGLYIVATPIGNLGDITLRALATLAAADLIACEDTRVTRVLLQRYGIATPMLAYHEHNATRQRPKILAALYEDGAVALVSDAGTPLVSDPGYRLVTEAVDAGHAVIPIPGPSALMAALVAAALPTDAFFFAGFLPPKPTARRKRLADLAAVPATLLIYESPRRLAEALGDMVDVLGGDRVVAVARELTKAFETIRRGTLGGLAEEFSAEAAPRGEVVVVVGPPVETAMAATEVEALLVRLLADNSVRTAAEEAAALTGLPRRDLYRRALALKDEGGGT